MATLNAMKIRSLRMGSQQVTSDRIYRGANPVYVPVMNSHGMITGHRRAVPGIPFVRSFEEQKRNGR